MIHYRTVTNRQTAERSGLSVQIKSQWQRGELDKETVFIHASDVPPERVRESGLSPEFAKEYLMTEDGEQLGEGKMIFAMVEGSSDKAIRLLWGDGEHYFKFRAPAGTTCYTTDGVIARNREVAFPYLIEPADFIGL